MKDNSLLLLKDGIDEIRTQGSISENKVEIEFINLLSKGSYINSNGILTDLLEYNGQINTHFIVQDSLIKSYFPRGSEGIINTSFNIKGKGKVFYTKGDLKLTKFNIPKLLDIPSGKAEFENNDKDILITSMFISGDYGKLKSTESFKFLNLQNKSFYSINLGLNLQEFHLDKILNFKENVLDGLNASLTGKVQCSSDFKKIEIVSKKLSSKKIYYAASGRRIIDYRNATLKDLKFEIDLEDKKTRLGSEVHLKDTVAKVEARIGEKVEVLADFEELNLKEVLSIDGLDFWGRGPGRLKVIADSKDILFKILLKTKESKFLNYRFGEIDTEMDLFLNKSILKIKKAKLQKETSQYSIQGVVDFKNKTHLDLDAKVVRSSYKMLKDLIYPISSGLNFLPQEIAGFIGGRFKIFGTIGSLEVAGAFDGKQLDFQGESIPNIKGSFSYQKEVLSINDILIKKRSGVITGDYFFDVKKIRINIVLK